MLAVVIIAAVSVVMQCGASRIYLCFARKQEASIGMLFGEFTKRPDRYIIGYLLLFGLEILCMHQSLSPNVRLTVLLIIVLILPMYVS